ncbi:MAG: cupin domain-containing protein [Actinobacteria bacterium]|nr:MAG: cupin domain-containing protein [Actinomycetota bacterium]
MRKNHIVHRAGDALYSVPEAFAARSNGFSRWSMVDHDGPAVHTGFGLSLLEPGGTIDRHVHSFEESFFVLEGEVVVDTAEASVLLRPGDYGVIPVGSPHRWRNEGAAPVRWADMRAPQPQPGFRGDTFFVPASPSADPIPVDPRDPRMRSFGHIDPANMDTGRQTQDMLAVSASMRTALLVYSGITVKMMVDSDLGAHLQTMFMVQYQPNGVAGAHDHPLEETYLILEGETIGRFDGEEYRLGPGDMAFAGVGCVHEFSNPNDTIVRWLETQAPQPPARHSYRFARDWLYLRGVDGVEE